MSLPAQKFREVVFQMLYSYDTGRATDDDMLELLSSELSVTKKSVREAQGRVRNILSHLDAIDASIAKTSQSYAFERIQTVERNILRLAVFEMLFDSSTPEKVAISEAMRLARKFSTKESASFINAILDALLKSSQGKPIEKKELQESAKVLNLIEEISQEAALRQKDNENSP